MGRGLLRTHSHLAPACHGQCQRQPLPPVRRLEQCAGAVGEPAAEHPRFIALAAHISPPLCRMLTRSLCPLAAYHVHIDMMQTVSVQHAGWKGSIPQVGKQKEANSVPTACCWDLEAASKSVDDVVSASSGSCCLASKLACSGAAGSTLVSALRAVLGTASATGWSSRVLR